MRFFGYYLGVVETLIALNVLVFIITILSPEFIIVNFGLQPLSFLERPWIILTSMFLHGSFYHILANMMTLFFFGLYLERLVGEKEFLKIYFFGGIAGGILFLLLAPAHAIAVGASGAIFAIGGALAVLRPHLQVVIFPFPVPISLWIAVIGGFFFLSVIPGVAWQGHLGGLLIGLIFGYYHKKKELTSAYFLRREEYGYRFS
jgi:membrane associated rhomboid family serine protease